MWPPASAGQPPSMHPGHPGTPTAHDPFANHPFGAVAGCGCAAARSLATIGGRCDRHTRPAMLPHNMPTAQASAFRYSPHTQELHGHALAPVTGGAVFHPAGSACLAGPYSSVNSLLGQLHAERVAAGERSHTHAHIAASSTSSILPRASPRPAPRGLQPSRSLVWQARASLGTKGLRKTTRCRQTPTVVRFAGQGPRASKHLLYRTTVCAQCGGNVWELPPRAAAPPRGPGGSIDGM